MNSSTGLENAVPQHKIRAPMKRNIISWHEPSISQFNQYSQSVSCCNTNAVCNVGGTHSSLAKSRPGFALTPTRSSLSSSKRLSGREGARLGYAVTPAEIANYAFSTRQMLPNGTCPPKFTFRFIRAERHMSPISCFGGFARSVLN